MLLILADELSIWNRATLITEQNGDDIISHRLEKRNVPSEIRISITERKRHNKIKIVPDRSNDIIKKSLCEDLSFFKPKRKSKGPKILDCTVTISSG